MEGNSNIKEIAYASGFSDKEKAILPFIEAAKIATEMGVGLNAGHDLIKKSGKNYINEIHHDIDVQPDNTLIKYFYSKI